jgi:hypothetical protein
MVFPAAAVRKGFEDMENKDNHVKKLPAVPSGLSPLQGNCDTSEGRELVHIVEWGTHDINFEGFTDELSARTAARYLDIGGAASYLGQGSRMALEHLQGLAAQVRGHAEEVQP